MIYFSHRFCVTSRIVTTWFHAKSLIVSDLNLSMDMRGRWHAQENGVRANPDATNHL